MEWMWIFDWSWDAMKKMLMYVLVEEINDHQSHTYSKTKFYPKWVLYLFQFFNLCGFSNEFNCHLICVAYISQTIETNILHLNHPKSPKLDFFRWITKVYCRYEMLNSFKLLLELNDDVIIFNFQLSCEVSSFIIIFIQFSQKCF